jgi:type IV pilus assembly protein PilM
MATPNQAAQKTAQPAPPKANPLAPLLNQAAAFLTNLLSSTQNVIGIDIGSTYIKLLQLQKKGKTYVVRNVITRALPQAAKDNPAEKKKLVQEFVKQFVAEGRIKNVTGRVAVYGKGVFVFSLTVPALSKKDLRGAVGIELKKRLPFQLDINNVTFDYFVTGQTKDEKGAFLQISCVAADRITLDEEVQMLKDMGIRPVIINAIPDCMGNLVPFCFDAIPKKTVALLDIGANTTLLNFYRGKNLVFSREIPVGGEHLTHAMAKPINSPAGQITITPEDAEKLKRNCGIPLEDEAKIEFLTDYGPLRGEQISAMLRPTLERLVMEISRTLSYYAKTFHTPPIDEIYLTGGSSRLRNIDKFLLFNLEGMQKVAPLNILKSVKGWADRGVFKQELMMEQAAPHLAVVFGLCLGNAGKVNLLPNKERLEQKAALVSTVLRVIFPVLLVTSFVFYALSFTTALKYKVFVNNLNGEINRLELTASKVRQYRELKTKLEQRKELLEKAKGKQPYWWGAFKEISLITPKEVILSRVSIDGQKEPKQIRIYGKIFARYTIVDVALSQYVIALEESPFFSDVKQENSTPDMYSAIPAATFEIVARMDY